MTPKKKPGLKANVIKRGKTWSYVIRVKDPSGGSRPRWVGGFATEAEAKEARDEARVRAGRGEYVHRNEITVEEYLHDWLAGHSLEIRAKTASDYAGLINRYVNPRIGGMRLQSVKPGTLSTFYATLLHEGGRKGAPLSPRTVNYVHSVLRKAFNDAVHIDQLIHENPAMRAKRPKSQGLRTIRAPWDATELRRFLEAVEDHRLFAFFRLAAFTGARRGELLFLRWKNVHLDDPNPFIWIVGSTALVDGHLLEGATKTSESRRVTIDPGTVEVLRQHKERQEKDRALVGPEWPNSDLVFRREMGTPLQADAPRGVLLSTIGQVNRDLRDGEEPLPKIRLHELRHIHATLLLKAGVPVHVVAARLGHKDPAMTLRVYAHVLSEQETSAATRFADLLDPEGNH